MKHLVSIHDLSQDEMHGLFDRADQIVSEGIRGDELHGFVIAMLFLEASTRTRLSFDSAAERLGAGVTGFVDAKNTSVSKGETFHDTIMVTQYYCDLIVVRHSENGSAKYASEISSVPIVNAGDGSNEHPTQTLLDLYTIRRRLGTLSGLTIGMYGDLRFGRTAHSLASALAPYGVNFVWIAPPDLQMPEEYGAMVESKGSTFIREYSLASSMGDLDVLYATRPQRERWESLGISDSLEVLNANLVRKGKPSLIVMHPLPRTSELSTDVDAMPNAAYFEQVANSIPVRMAILEYCLAGTSPKLVRR